MHHPQLPRFGPIIGLVSLLGAGFVPVLAQDVTPAFSSSTPFAGLGLADIAVTITATTFESVPPSPPLGATSAP